MHSHCDEIKIPENVIGSVPMQIMSDETGFKGDGQNGKARKKDLKVVIGISGQGDIFLLANEAGASWKDISDQWEKMK